MCAVLHLQRLCLISIVDTLEQLPVDHLSLLPAHLRFDLLRNLPVVDICKLEQTSFVAGLDTEKVWEELFEKHTKYYHVPNHYPGGDNDVTRDLQKFCGRRISKKDLYLSTISTIILNNFRPCGLWVVGREQQLQDQVGLSDPIKCTPDDIVNYLVATSREDLHLVDRGKVPVTDRHGNFEWTENNKTFTCYPASSCSRAFVDENHQWENEVYPHYKEACLRHHYIPKRYVKYLQSDHHRISDEQAIAVITKECGYFPSTARINTYNFKTRWAANLKNTTFTSFFQRLNCLGIHEDKGVDDCHIHVVLNAVTSNEKPCLSSLTIHMTSLKLFYFGSSGYNRIDTLLCKLPNLHTLRTYVFPPKVKVSLRDKLRMLVEYKEFIRRPHFQCLVLAGTDFDDCHVKDLILCFLSLDSQIVQTFEMWDIDSDMDLYNSPQPIDFVAKKNLILPWAYNTSPLYGSIWNWFFTLPKLHLRSLAYVPLQFIPLMADHPNFHVLQLVLSHPIRPCVFSQDDVNLLLCNHSVIKLAIVGEYTFDILSPYLVNAFEKQLTIRELAFSPFSVSQQSAAFFHAFFSLPNLENFSVSIVLGSCGFALHIIQMIYDIWQKVTNNARKLKAFKFETLWWYEDLKGQPTIDMLNSMGAELYSREPEYD